MYINSAEPVAPALKVLDGIEKKFAICWNVVLSNIFVGLAKNSPTSQTSLFPFLYTTISVSFNKPDSFLNTEKPSATDAFKFAGLSTIDSNSLAEIFVSLVLLTESWTSGKKSLLTFLTFSIISINDKLASFLLAIVMYVDILLYILSNGSTICLLLPLKNFNGFLTFLEKLPLPEPSIKSL